MRKPSYKYNWYKPVSVATSLAYKYMNPGAPTNTSTKVKARKFNRMPRRSKQTSYASGFLKKPKKFKKNKYAHGIVQTWEYGGTTSGSLTVTVGHATCNKVQMLYSLAYAITKRLAMEMKKPIDNFNSTIADAANGDIVYLTSRVVGDITNTPSNTNVRTVTTTDTWKTIAEAIGSAIAGFTDTQRELINVTYQFVNDAQGSIKMDLRNASFSVQSKSSAKFQNKSVPAAGTDEDNADDVDNVPLYGKSYEGYGSGTTRLNPSTIFSTDSSLFSDQTTGLISCSSNSYDEPPVPETFAQVKKVGKVHISPGKIKTSVLFYTWTGNVNEFINKMGADFVTGIGKYRVGLGKFRFLTLEKMVETNQTTPYALTVGCEVNTEVRAILYPSKPPITSRVVYRGDLTFT